MPKIDFVDRLQTGDVLVMDGATGSELQRRGVDVNKGSVEGKLGVWSAAANLDAPKVVQAIHEDYLNAGAEIITVTVPDTKSTKCPSSLASGRTGIHFVNFVSDTNEALLR